MFKETDYYDRKMKIWDCDKKIDLEKPAPQNLRYTNTIDTIIEFYKPVQNYDEYSVDFYSLITSLQQTSYNYKNIDFFAVIM
uniref:hypothetical protein n=1 Tax=uncultured Ruminococcus sp. TaxID=165186 RepID=UPI0025E32759|nr:hypothetical protein [uncultured Ruminococcus sp.]